MRLNDAAADIDETKYVQSQQFKEALYGSYLRSTKGFDATTVRTAYTSGGNTLNVDDYQAFSTGATHNAVTEESTVDSFTYTGTTSSNSGQITGVSNLSDTPEDVYVVDLKRKKAMQIHNGNILQPALMVAQEMQAVVVFTSKETMLLLLITIMRL